MPSEKCVQHGLAIFYCVECVSERLREASLDQLQCMVAEFRKEADEELIRSRRASLAAAIQDRHLGFFDWVLRRRGEVAFNEAAVPVEQIRQDLTAILGRADMAASAIDRGMGLHALGDLMAVIGAARQLEVKCKAAVQERRQCAG